MPKPGPERSHVWLRAASRCELCLTQEAISGPVVSLQRSTNMRKDKRK